MMENRGFLFSLLTALGRVIIPLLGSTLRLTVRKDHCLDACRAEGGRFIYAVWHGRMLGLIFTERGKGISALISQHRDGDYVSRIVRSLGFNPVRGSTGSGGSRALKEMVREGLNGRDLAVTPDGPCGPRYRAKMGVVKLAQLTRMPVVPVGFSSSKALVFNSWDRFLLPLPFSRCAMVFGAPIWVNSRVSAEEARMELETALTYLTAQAERLC